MRSAPVPSSLVCTLLALFSALAQAEPYVGASAGFSAQSLVCAAGAACDKRAAALRAFGGWQFNDQFGAEISWSRNLGDFIASDRLSSLTWSGRFAAQVLGASATWVVDAGPVDLQLRAGVAAVRGEFHSRTAGVADSKNTRMQALFGLGVQRAISGQWRLRADAELTDARAYTREGHHATFTVGIERHF